MVHESSVIYMFTTHSRKFVETLMHVACSDIGMSLSWKLCKVYFYWELLAPRVFFCESASFSKLALGKLSKYVKMLQSANMAFMLDKCSLIRMLILCSEYLSKPRYVKRVRNTGYQGERIYLKYMSLG